MKVNTILSVLLVCFLLVSGVSGTVVAQEDSQEDQEQTEEQQTEDESEQEQEEQFYTEDEVEATNNENYNIGSVTVTKLVYLEDGTIVATIDARRPTEVTASYQEDSNGDLGRSFHDLEQGQNTIRITGSHDGQLNIWEGADGEQISPPSISIIDLPIAQWLYSWEIFIAGILGTIVAIIYDYRRLMHNKVKTVRSIFEIDWWK